MRTDAKMRKIYTRIKKVRKKKYPQKLSQKWSQVFPFWRRTFDMWNDKRTCWHVGHEPSTCDNHKRDNHKRDNRNTSQLKLKYFTPIIISINIPAGNGGPSDSSTEGRSN